VIILSEHDNDSKELIQSFVDKLDSYTARQHQSIKEYSSSEKIEAELKKVDEKRNIVLQYIGGMSKDIYSMEVEREHSILQQASNMQSAFSFVTAGLFVIAQVVSDHRGNNLCPFAIFIGFGLITFLLLVSLFLATMAQNRYSHDGAPTIQHLLSVLNNDQNIENLQNDNARVVFTISQYSAYYSSLRKINNKRALYVKLSMFFFKVALVSSAIVAIILGLLDGF